jgi:Tol biopolymer transport system component
MRRLSFVLLSLTLTALACNLPGTQISTPTSGPDTVATAVAATLTAGAPTPTTETSVTETLAPPTAPGDTATPAASGFACSVAYTKGSQLYCLKVDGTPLLLADPGSESLVSSPQISPDGALIAYLLNLPNNTSELWVVHSDGSGNHRLVSRDQVTRGDPNVAESPNVFEWQSGTHTIFFNLRYILLSGEGGPGEYVYNDLWKVDADTGTVLNVLPRDSVGRFFLSPNGQHIALSLPQAIELSNADGADRQHLLDFPFINTASEYAFKPAATWSLDSSSFLVLIPSAEPMAADASGTIYRMGVDGSVQKLTTFAGNFVFGGSLRPEISPDGRFVIYSQSASDGSSALHLARTDGSSDTVIDHQPSPNGLSWSPDSNHYAYVILPSGGAGGGFVAPVEGPLQPFASGATILSLKWWDNASFIFHGLVGTEWGLYYQRLGEPLQREVGGLNNQSSFDVRAP